MALMPWACKTAVEARREFVSLAKSPRANIRDLCRHFNVSPNTAYKLLNRFRAEGEEGLQDRSSRPLHSPSRIPKAVENAVISVRAEQPLWGARRIAKELRAQGMTKVPAPSSIHNILSRHDLVHSKHSLGALECLSAVPKDRAEILLKAGLPPTVDEPDMQIVIEHLLSKRVLERRRAMVIMASRRGVRPAFICKVLRLSPSTYRRCVRVFSEGGAAALFARRTNPHRKFDNERIKNALFDTLHQPPGNFGINRTTWRLADLSLIMGQRGYPICEDVIRQIIKAAGYRWRKARIVLTSNDPEFSEKLGTIQSILAGLPLDEAFFSIDEYGPVAVKAQPGRSLVAPDERHIVPQWQKSRGSITVTAALELSSNQITHGGVAKVVGIRLA
jgi:transposase